MMLFIQSKTNNIILKRCLKGQTLIQNKPSISEGYFSASLEKALFCGLSWILSLSMFCTGFSNFYRIMNLQTTGKVIILADAHPSESNRGKNQ